MPHELAAAAFVRGAARSTAAEPWKAAVRTPTYLPLPSPRAHRRHFLSTPSTSPPDAAHRRRSLTISACIQENASGFGGLDYSCTHHFLPANDPPSLRFLAVAPSSEKKVWKHGGCAYSNSSTSLRAGASPSDYAGASPSDYAGPTFSPGSPNLRRLARTSYLFLIVLKKMGRLVPPPKAGKRKAALSFTILSLGLLAGYMATKDEGKLATMIKACDGAMKIYKVFTEIVDILSTFFK